MSFFYLLGLLAAIGGLALLDFRHRLALAKNVKHFYLILMSVAFFLIWDFAGISLGIFFRGETKMLSGVLIAPELPLEELFFLILLSYNALLLLKFFNRFANRRAERAGKK